MASTTTPILDPSADPPTEVWSGPSWMQGVQEVVVRIFLIACALITVLTTVGIVVVLGFQTLRFFSITQVNPIAFVTGTTLEPDGEPPRFGIFGPDLGHVRGCRRIFADCGSHRFAECDLPERIRASIGACGFEARSGAARRHSDHRLRLSCAHAGHAGAQVAAGTHVQGRTL